MNEIKFSSTLSKDHYEDLKNLLFFNSQQRKVVSGIEASIEKYGMPEIINHNNILRIQIDSLKDVQTIFAIDSSEKSNVLIGVIVFFRETLDNITILHIAVKEEYTMTSSNVNSFITIHLIEQLRKLASKLKGIRTLTIFYHKDTIGKIKVK